jgi:DNA-directed RNA polymerase specialized sigma24 family protein
VDQLHEAQRKTIELFFWQNLSYQQIADNTGFEVNQVKSFLQNGKRNVKICVENHGQKA